VILKSSGVMILVPWRRFAYHRTQYLAVASFMLIFRVEAPTHIVW